MTWGHNRALWFHLKPTAGLIKPAQKRVWQFIKSRTHAFLFLHSCGSVREFIPDFIEMGLDILNPVQVAARDMDPIELKREFGKDLTFWGEAAIPSTSSPLAPRTTWRERSRGGYRSWPRAGGLSSTRSTISSLKFLLRIS